MADREEPESSDCRWDEVILVCRQCRQRSSGPRKLKTKEVAGALRHELRGSAVRARVVLSNCLGLCPKRATTVAHIGAESGAMMWAVSSAKAATTLGRRLSARGTDSASAPSAAQA